LELYKAVDLGFFYPDDPSFGLKGIRFSVREGESVGFLGPNGAGKSTLLRILAGLLHPTSGRVDLQGRPLRDLPLRERAKKIAYLPQSVQFTFPMRVGDIVEMGRHPYLGRLRSMTREDRAACQKALASCDALHLVDRSFDGISGGEKQRVLLASALAQTPRVLLLDEPTHSLDLSHQADLLRILRQLQKEEGLTLLLATHDLNLAASCLEKVVLMKDGRIDSQGAPSKALTPAKVRSLFGARVAGLRAADGTRRFFPRLARVRRGE
jgi:iron complex transport system ATP-binding protein